ncbi:hypothetical protein SIPHO075v1_p0046 [Vibrio phage PS65A.1]|nr:hypothetical protein SIPHO075v1_p0046 [Vibrio phage PS65A.1]
MKINKQIKTHIADMAIRKKYKAEFTELMQAMKDKAYSELYNKYHNEDFDLLPERALNLVQRCGTVDISTIQMEHKVQYGRDIGYGLHVAFDTYSSIQSITLDKQVLGCGHKIYNASELFSDEYAALTSFLKEASKARQTLLDAMAHYKSCKKMFAELPWTETYYPESEKKPVTNIVPVSTIAAANELMGL